MDFPEIPETEEIKAFRVGLNNYVFHRMGTRVEKPVYPERTTRVVLPNLYAAFGGSTPVEKVIEYYGDAFVTAFSWELGEKIPLIRVGYLFKTDPCTFCPVVELFYEKEFKP